MVILSFQSTFSNDSWHVPPPFTDVKSMSTARANSTMICRRLWRDCRLNGQSLFSSLGEHLSGFSGWEHLSGFSGWGAPFQHLWLGSTFPASLVGEHLSGFSKLLTEG